MTARVLFVDDETRVLDGLRRGLFTLDVEWDAEYADSGASAIRLLETSTFDAVITDMQMAPMSGADLLGVVRERWPTVLRFILSGHVQTDAAVRALQVAQQLISKPCDVRTLVDVVESGFAVQRQLSTPIVRSSIGRLKSLPVAPRVHAQINEALLDPGCDARKIAGILTRDPALTAKVLHLANSAYFNGGGRLSADIHQAVARIGLNTVADLVLATEVFDSALYGNSAEALRDRALLTSRLAAQIAAGRPDANVASTAALLADIAYLLPGVESITAAQAGPSLSRHAHAEIGASLLEMWSLPRTIVEAVANHHSPMSAPRNEFGVPGIVHVATALACGVEPDHDFLAAHDMLAQLPAWKAMCDTLCSGS